MTREELLTMVNELKKVFDTVRLVDATMSKQIDIADDGELLNTPYRCYDIWHKPRQCQNCISSKALAQKRQLTKFEMLDGSVCTIVAKYIEVDGQPYVLELISKLDNETIFSAFGKTEIIQNIMEFSNTMYIDPLTRAYNRRFFEEQFITLETHCAVAFVDLDKFKDINDTYGHDAGDKALKRIVQIILANIRPDDIVVRYGGDELVLSFAQISKDAFEKRLKQIQMAVRDTVFPEYPDLHMTISAGGYYSKTGDRMDMVKQADKMCYEAKRERDSVKVAFGSD